MKAEIHSDNYRPVIFKDTSSGEKFLISSTIETDQTDTWEDNKEYPMVEVEVSSSSHPFYTGQEKVLDTTGRVERFKERQQKATPGYSKKKKEKKEEESTQSATEGSISINKEKEPKKEEVKGEAKEEAKTDN